MGLDEIPDDGEPQPGAGRGRALDEPVEDAGQELRGDSLPVVPHRDPHPTRGRARLHPHGPAAPGVGERVGDQVAEHPAELGWIRAQHGKGWGQEAIELHPGGRRLGAERLDGLVDEKVDVHGLAVGMQRACLGEGERAKVVRQGLEGARGGDDRGDVLLVGWIHPVGDGLRLAADHRERGAELVGDVGEHGSAPRLLRLEAGAHRVEGTSEGAHLPRAPDRDPRRVIAVLDLTGGTDQVSDRGRHPAQGDADPHRGDDAESEGGRCDRLGDPRRADQTEGVEGEPHQGGEPGQDHQQGTTGAAAGASRHA